MVDDSMLDRLAVAFGRLPPLQSDPSLCRRCLSVVNPLCCPEQVSASMGSYPNDERIAVMSAHKSAHKLTLEHENADFLDNEAYRAYCSCGWTGTWQHADVSADDAETAAVEEGSEHIADLC